jgi:hypothetical protein
MEILLMLPFKKLISTMMVVLISMNSVASSVSQLFSQSFPMYLFFSGRNLGGGVGGGAGGGYSASSFESASYGGGAGFGAGAGAGFGAGGSSFESSSFESSGASLGGGYDASLAVGGGLAGSASSYESSSFSSGGGYGGDAGFVAGGAVGLGGSSFESSSSSAQVQRYATDAQGLFQDPNPQIIRRPAVGGVQTYTQNIKVRFLQPPPVPPPGVSCIYHFGSSIL